LTLFSRKVIPERIIRRMSDRFALKEKRDIYFRYVRELIAIIPADLGAQIFTAETVYERLEVHRDVE